MPSFVEIAPIGANISRHAEYVLTDGQHTAGRTADPNT